MFFIGAQKGLQGVESGTRCLFSIQILYVFTNMYVAAMHTKAKYCIYFELSIDFTFSRNGENDVYISSKCKVN